MAALAGETSGAWRVQNGSRPRLIKRVSCIDRKAVVVDRVAVSAFIDRPCALVAIAAEGAQRAEPELVVVAAMPWVMISDRRRGDAALLLAQGAQRLDLQLVLGPSSPGLQRVPIAPMPLAAGVKKTSVHRLEISPAKGGDDAVGRPPHPRWRRLRASLGIARSDAGDFVAEWRVSHGS
jgi:hypothetical protein